MHNRGIASWSTPHENLCGSQVALRLVEGERARREILSSGLRSALGVSAVQNNGYHITAVAANAKSIRRRKSLANETRLLDFIQHSDCIILDGDPALALGIRHKLLRTRAVFADACTGLNKCRRTEVGPVDRCLTERGQCIAVCQRDGLPRLGEIGSVDQL